MPGFSSKTILRREKILIGTKASFPYVILVNMLNQAILKAQKVVNTEILENNYKIAKILKAVTPMME